jgi:hypothetical protein
MSGIYKFTCNICKMSYIGQTSRNLNQRYRKHIHYTRNNNPQSAYAQHIHVLQNLQNTDLKPIISVGHRHHDYVSNHMKTKTDQHATHTLKSFPTLHDSNRQQYGCINHSLFYINIAFSAEYTLSTTNVLLI